MQMASNIKSNRYEGVFLLMVHDGCPWIDSIVLQLGPHLLHVDPFGLDGFRSLSRLQKRGGKMMASDYGKWFICTDGSMDAIKCSMESFVECLKDLFGPERASKLFPKFRRASFSENCKLELESMEG